MWSILHADVPKRAKEEITFVDKCVSCVYYALIYSICLEVCLALTKTKFLTYQLIGGD